MVIISTVLRVLFPIFTGLAISELRSWAVLCEWRWLQVMFQPLPLFMNHVEFGAGFHLPSLSSLIYMLLMSRIISHSTNEVRKGLFGKLARLTVSFFLTVIKIWDILSRLP